MTRIKRFPTADVRATARKKIPAFSSDALEYYMLARDSLEAASSNLALGKDHGALVGSVTSHTGYISCDGLVSYLQTELVEPDEFTFVILARSPDTFAASANRPGFMGTFNGPSSLGSATSLGAFLIANSATALTGGATQWDGSTSGSVSSNNSAISSGSGIDLTKWNLMSLRQSATQRILADHSTAFAPVVYANANPRYPTTNKVRIGSVFTTYGGLVDVAAAVIFSRSLSDAELAEVLAEIRAQAALDGIVEGA